MREKVNEVAQQKCFTKRLTYKIMLCIVRAIGRDAEFYRRS